MRIVSANDYGKDNERQDNEPNIHVIKWAGCALDTCKRISKKMTSDIKIIRSGKTKFSVSYTGLFFYVYSQPYNGNERGTKSP